MPIEMRGACPYFEVVDMPTSIRFYRDVLGFTVHEHAKPVAEDDYGWCWLKHGDSTDLMLNTAYDDDERPDAPDPARVAAHRDTCLYIGCPDVDAAYRFLVEKGLKIKEPKVAWYGMKQLYVTDPDGFGLCLQWRAQSDGVHE